MLCLGIMTGTLIVMFVALPPLQSERLRWLPIRSSTVLLIDGGILLASLVAIVIAALRVTRSPARALLVIVPAPPVYLILLLVAAWYVPYVFALVRCLHEPVIVSDFMAAYSYYLPGDRSYSPSALSDYVCTAAEAERDGYRRAPIP